MQLGAPLPRSETGQPVSKEQVWTIRQSVSIPTFTNLYPLRSQGLCVVCVLQERNGGFVMENRTTVFYVDDNPKSSRLLTSVLEECGFRVITKNDPLEALALCVRTYFDLALLDYEMPLMSGTQLARKIKFLLPEDPVVLLSGRVALPSTDLTFVDAHFGYETALHDPLRTTRIPVRPKLVIADHHLDRHADQRTMAQWADAT